MAPLTYTNKCVVTSVISQHLRGRGMISLGGGLHSVCSLVQNLRQLSLKRWSKVQHEYEVVCVYDDMRVHHEFAIIFLRFSY